MAYYLIVQAVFNMPDASSYDTAALNDTRAARTFEWETARGFGPLTPVRGRLDDFDEAVDLMAKHRAWPGLRRTGRSS